jgi:hypothetical protein
MVASWRVKMAMSLGLMRLPERMRRFLILPGTMPWRRSAANTWFSPAARVSPRTALPLRSLPSHSKTNSLMLWMQRLPWCPQEESWSVALIRWSR